MMNLFGEQTSAANLFSAYASLAASLMLLRTMFNDIIPEPVKSYLSSIFGGFFKYLIDKFCSKITTKMTVVVDEEIGITLNQVYDAAEIYLRTIINPDVQRLKASKGAKQKSISLSMEKNELVADCFQGIDLKWQFVFVEPDGRNTYQPAKRYFELTFDKSEKERVVNEYLPYVLARSKEIKANDRAVKLYTRDCPFDSDDEDGGNRGAGYWGCIHLDHPITFEKMAMDLKLKQAIKDDLDRFLRRREYYRKVGKAWKRGYLLYGPPGTGKSSLIAAIANYLKFDVYDLELSSVYDNKELRKLLLCINSKSIIVIEDIDCSAQMQDRGLNGDAEPDFDDDTRLTLSGVLNFIDGLWSACGDERIIIFTTNHKEKLDPALLRPGRMDMHIHMGYCTPEGFDVLAFNYLGLSDHPKKFPEIKELIEKVEMSPAEIAEHLMRNEDADLALEGIIDLLKEKKTEQNETTDKIDQEKKDKKDVGNDGDKGKDEKQSQQNLLRFRRQSQQNSLRFRRRVNRKLNKPMNR